ncbi:hypothetical protein DAPPUDRAFT_115455 [Daphnia pulex]|uniref:FLYWCH-type domain-containing protein n=1 Tax=Daphnia pulex TaxID=6669 RepID=E9HLE4_DAPPU|nr:hypothetical protein DAPPUDRAFT_115455 [Daphnia pulex]|eukprot:EFX67422.1 hypothetical protein DAPPUDRAFT_115455 [Daphnia pulex]
MLMTRGKELISAVAIVLTDFTTSTTTLTSNSNRVQCIFKNWCPVLPNHGIKHCIIPDFWLHDTNFCYYPAKRGDVACAKREQPNSTWLKYKCVYRVVFDTFSQARDKVSRAVHHSDINTASKSEGNRLGRGKRIKRTRAVYSPTPNQESSTEEEMESEFECTGSSVNAMEKSSLTQSTESQVESPGFYSEKYVMENHYEKTSDSGEPIELHTSLSQQSTTASSHPAPHVQPLPLYTHLLPLPIPCRFGKLPFRRITDCRFGNIAEMITSKRIVQFVNCVSCSLPIHIGCIPGNKLGKAAANIVIHPAVEQIVPAVANIVINPSVPACRTRFALGPFHCSSMLGQMLHPVRQDPGVTISPIDGFGFVIDTSPAEEAVQLLATPIDPPIEPPMEQTSYFARPIPAVEASLPDPIVEERDEDSESSSSSSRPRQWHVEPEAGKRRKPMLIDDSNRGLGIWNVRKTGTVMWRCNFRPKRNPCKALVSQSGEKFIEHHPHTCKSKEHLKINVLLSARAKKVALENIKEPALKIVEPLIVETLEKNPEWNPVDPDVCDNNWIVGSVWPPIKWSVFNQPITGSMAE